MPNFTTSNVRPAAIAAPPPKGPPVDGSGGPVNTPNPQGGPACGQVTTFQVTKPGDAAVTLFGNLQNNAAQDVIWDSVDFVPDDGARWALGHGELVGRQAAGTTVQLSIKFTPPAK